MQKNGKAEDLKYLLFSLFTFFILQIIFNIKYFIGDEENDRKAI
jgi:hypothetical protein